MSEDDAGQALVDMPKLYFRTIDGKSNLAPPAHEDTWYHLDNIELPNGTNDG